MTINKAIPVPNQENDLAAHGLETCDGGVCAASGIRAAGVAAGFRRNPQRLDLALVVAERLSSSAATFTQNRFCAAPVQLSRQRASTGHACAVLLNSGNANAATGDQGMMVARDSAALVAERLGCAQEDVLVASTGVIGVQQPMEPFFEGIPLVIAGLGSDAAHAHDAAMAVMTTDTYPKESAVSGVLCDGRHFHVGGFVKGSGMIQPYMATMLAVITTDAPLSVLAARNVLRAAVDASFNKVTVDSDTSTNDSCFLFSTGAAGGDLIEEGCPDFDIVRSAITCVCERLAKMIAADGEGATKLVTVNVVGADTDDDAQTIARSIANSPLVKTAMFGHDANWGRIAAAAGKCGVSFRQEDIDIDLLGVPMLRNGLPVPFDEDDMLARFEAPELTITVSLGSGLGAARIWTCDLTHDYITINGDYRT